MDVVQVVVLCDSRTAAGRAEYDVTSAAVDAINNKTDGVFDDLLPNTIINLTVAYEGCGEPHPTMLYVMPCSAVFLFVIAAVTEWTPLSQLSECVASLPWWLLLLDCACSVGFNLTMLRFIGTLSAVNYALYSLLKDIALLTIAFLFFSEELYASRIEGWAVTICGCCVWQHRKLRERRNLQ